MNNLSYMDKLLDGVEVETLALGDIGEFIRGNGIQKKDLIEEGFPAVHYGQIFTRYGFSAVQAFTFISDGLAKKSRIAQKSDLLIATTSENDEDVLKYDVIQTWSKCKVFSILFSDRRLSKTKS
jgi:type I restriction enzyme S subunit